MTGDRKCPSCGVVVGGRPNKHYCSRRCRKRENNRRSQAAHPERWAAYYRRYRVRRRETA